MESADVRVADTAMDDSTGQVGKQPQTVVRHGRFSRGVSILLTVLSLPALFWVIRHIVGIGWIVLFGVPARREVAGVRFGDAVGGFALLTTLSTE